MTLARLLDDAHVLLCLGGGGVGKTTTAAALAVGAARRGRRTAVVTVDPAQRLRDALGLEHVGGRPHAVELCGAAAPLHAMLLDVKGTFDDLVRSLASDAGHAEAILDNRIYRNLSGALAGSAEYMAVETVHRLYETGEYDLIVVDTPPARHAVDFLDAPRRLVAVLDSQAFQILQHPASILPSAGSRIAELVLRGVLFGLERVTGLGLVREIGDFVALIESLTDALRDRMRAVAELLAADATVSVLVTAPEPRLTTETTTLARLLAERELGLCGVIVNRAVPQAIFGPGAPTPTAPLPLEPGLRARLDAVWQDLRTVAAREAETIVPLLAEAEAPLLAEVPLLPSAPATLPELDALAAHLLRA